VDQFGVSACGPTAICNVILGLLTIHRKSKHLIENHVLDDLEELLDPDVLSKGIPPRLRDYNAPLGSYLLSRVRAGTIHDDLIDGLRKISGNRIDGFFFQFAKNITDEDLYHWLAYWMDKGAVPVATLNLMLLGNDAWHHQMIFGVEKIPRNYYPLQLTRLNTIPLEDQSRKESSQDEFALTQCTENNPKTTEFHYFVYPTNSLEPYEMSVFRLCVTSEPFMIIPSGHVVERISDDMQLDILQKEPFVGTDVIDQIIDIIAFEAKRATRRTQQLHVSHHINNTDANKTPRSPDIAAPSGSDDTVNTEETNEIASQISTSKVASRKSLIDRTKLHKILQQFDDDEADTTSNNSNSQPQEKSVETLHFVASKNLFIPWGGLAGITLFVLANTDVHKELVDYRQKYSRQVYLPAYQRDTTVCVYPTPETKIS